MKKHVVALSVLLSWLLPQPSDAGPVIFDNGVTMEEAFFASGQALFFAENFKLTAGQTTVADVHWRGVYRSPPPPQIFDLFAIRVFRNDPDPAILSPLAPVLFQTVAQP